MLHCGTVLSSGNMETISFHYRAGDRELYLKPDKTNQVIKIQGCLMDTKVWVFYDIFNSDKTKIIVLGLKNFVTSRLDHYNSLLSGCPNSEKSSANSKL